MKARWNGIVIGFCLIWSLGLCAQETVTVTGAAAILQGDAAQARDKAIENAMRGAVEQVVGTMMDSESLVQNNDLLSDRIYTQTTGYISRHRIVSEKADPDINLYQVTVEATVMRGNLESDLKAMGILMRRMRMPRVTVALREYAEETSTTLIRLLKDKGFHVVDTGATPIPPGFWHWDQRRQTDLFKKYGAEVVILGTAEGHRGGYVANSSMKSYQGTVSLKALKTDTTEVLGASTGTGKAVHVGDAGFSEALAQAARLAGNDLVKQITKQWARESSSTRMVTLVLTGCSPGEARRISGRLLKEGRGIQDAYLREASGGDAHLEISLQGDANVLADEMRKLFPKWKVREQTANRLTLAR